jgi:hypothetical protein
VAAAAALVCIDANVTPLDAKRCENQHNLALRTLRKRKSAPARRWGRAIEEYARAAGRLEWCAPDRLLELCVWRSPSATADDPPTAHPDAGGRARLVTRVMPRS